MPLDPEIRRQAIDLLRQGQSVRQVEAELKRRGGGASKSAIGELRKEILGPSAEAVVRAEQAQAAAPPDAEASAAPPKPAAINHRQELLDSLQAVQRLCKASDDKVVLAAVQAKTRVLEQLRELDQATVAASGPRITYYFPERTDLQRLELPDS